MRPYRCLLRYLALASLSVMASFGQTLTWPIYTFPTAVNTGDTATQYSFRNITGGQAGGYLLEITGTLPPGLSANSTPLGTPQITGTFTTAGRFTFSVDARDTSVPTPRRTSRQTFTITVTTLPVTTPLLAPPFTIVAGSTSNLRLATISGGNDPINKVGYTVALTSGQVPPGTTLTLDLNDKAIELSGAFLAPGVFSFAAVATDASQPPLSSAPLNLTVTVTQGPFQIIPTNGNLPGLTFDTRISATQGAIANPLSPYATGGVPPYKWTIQGMPPPGLTLVAQTPTPFVQAAAALTGTPTAAGTYSYLLQATDNSPRPLTASNPFTSSVLTSVSFTDPSASTAALQKTNPTAITAGPDGTLWFTQQNSLQSGTPVYGVESLTTAGVFQHETRLNFPNLTTRYPVPGKISAGPDGSLWITDANLASGYLYQVKTDGTLGAQVHVQYQVGNVFEDVTVTSVTNGKAEGGVWFTGYVDVVSGNRIGLIGRVDPTDTSNPNLYPVPTLTANPEFHTPVEIIQDPNDTTGKAFWFLDSTGTGSTSAALLGRVAEASRTSVTFALPRGCPATSPNQKECKLVDASGTALRAVTFPFTNSTLYYASLMAALNGEIWFQTQTNAGKIAPADGSVTLFPGDVIGVAGSDGAIWGPDRSSGKTLTRTTSSGVITTFQFQNSVGKLLGIASGPDGALWFADQTNQKIVRIFPSLFLDCGGASTSLTIGSPVSLTCAARGGKPNTSGPKYNYNAVSGLPAGLSSVQNADGTYTVSGTPAAAGFFSFAATDSSSPPQQSNRVFSSIPAPLQFTCGIPSSGYTAGNTYSSLSCGVTGGIAPYKYNMTGALPPGLSGAAAIPVNGVSSCGAQAQYCFQLSGTIDLYASGTFTFTVAATDTQGTSVPQNVVMTVAAAKVGVTCASNVQVVVGDSFKESCFRTRGNPPYTYSATNLPSGLSIDPSTGVISGTATTPGQYQVPVTIKDASSPGSPPQTQMVSIGVLSLAQTLGLICDFSPRANVGQPYSAACTAYGGTAPANYNLAGSIPPGLGLQGNLVSGTPIAPGPYVFTVNGVDAAGLKATQWVSLFVHPAVLTILSATLPSPGSNLPYAAVPLVEGGTPPYSFTVTAGALPSGLLLGTNTGMISGLASSGDYQFTLQVKDALGVTATSSYSGTVPALALLPSTNSFPIGTGVTEILNTHNGVNGLVNGPDGTLWFTGLDQPGGNVIGSISTDGKTVKGIVTSNALTSFSDAAGGDIAVGPDGELWIAQRDGNVVSQQPANVTQATRSFTPPTPTSNPAQIVAAPNGAVWFTETGANQIGHVDARGKLVEYAIPTPASGAEGIAVALDNSVWFTERAANKIGFVSVDGSTKNEFAILTPNSQPTTIILGPDNAFWFTESHAGKIGRIDLRGNILEYAVPAQNSAPEAITAGADGALYFSDRGANQIGRVTVAGVFSQPYPVDVGSGLSGITTGPDGAIWYAESSLSRIGRLNLVVPVNVTCALPPNPLVAQSTFSGICTGVGGTKPYTFAFDKTTTPPPGVAIDPKTGALSGTLTSPGTFVFNILIQDSSSPALNARSISYSITVSPLPLSATCTIPVARWLTSYAGSCRGVNGIPPYSYSISSGALPAGITIDPTSGNLTGTPTALVNSLATINVTDSNTPATTTVQRVMFSVQYGSVGPNGSLLTLGSVPGSQQPGQMLTGVTLNPNATLTQPLSGTVTLSFSLDSSILTQGILGQTYTTPAGYVDPALQFVDASGAGLGKSFSFTFQPGAQSIALPIIDPGTVGGGVSIVIQTDVPQGGGAFRIPAPKAIVEAGRVQFTNMTASGFDIEFVGIETGRRANNATITFNPASGTQIRGQTVFHYDISQTMQTWFASAAGLKYGGEFSLSFPFQFDGQMNAIGSVTVQLDDSDPVTGNR